MVEVSASIGNVPYKTTVLAGQNAVIVDEPLDHGGAQSGFNPFELLAAALASCTAITLRMYVNRKKWETGKITVDVSLIETGQNTAVFNRRISTENSVDPAAQTRLIAIANACPTHKLLSGTIAIETTLNQ